MKKIIEAILHWVLLVAVAVLLSGIIRDSRQTIVDGNFRPSGNELSKERTIVRGDLDMYYADNTTFPDGLEVYGDVYLGGSQIKDIGSVKVYGNLSLSGSPLEELPEEAKVYGEIRLEHSRLTDLPKAFSTPGSLVVYKSSITTLPDEMTIGENLYICQETRLTIGKNTTIGRDLIIEGCAADTLPKGLHVGNLKLNYSCITALPSDMQVDGKIYMHCTNLLHIPDHLWDKITVIE